MSERKVRVRFAPSPTGALHIGGVRTALYNYLFARQHGGDLIFRIEDTDSNRFVPGAEEYILESFKWLGIKFDEGVSFGGNYGPYRQSERREIYKKYVQVLLDNGSAYIAFDTPEELNAKREEIKNFLDETKFDSSIYITVGTLDYLKKGGRLTPAVAAIGTLLRIKPVLQIQGEKLDSFAKARTMKQAKQIMMDQIAKDMKERYNDPTGENTIISIAHTQESEAAEEFRQELLERFPGHDIIINPLSLSISCHIGPGSLAVTASVRHEFMK